MAKRKIIKIDEDKCNGCGLCIPNCPEGALQIIDGKARLVSDLFCDGLGACIGHCPQDAINIEEREAGPYGEKEVMANIVKQGKNTIIAHLSHLKEHNEFGYLKEAMDYLKEKGVKINLEEIAHAVHSGTGGGCPGSRMVDSRKKEKPEKGEVSSCKNESQLETWPVQLKLVPAFAPFLNGADILIAADCVPFAYADFHEDLLKERILLVGCPKLDDVSYYKEKISQIIKNNDIKSITYAHMEVPCCFGLLPVIKEAISESGKKINFKDVNISVKGEKIKENIGIVR
ncbi:MAG: 4Fe-4S ferredoxin [Omnitrophica bacterium RIFCSPLOWO2_01_FULL_45_24]|nr:MAG: 4Fe-4S ferredoxin [Omnitrophica bacterium RIFCSPLOWO2_12_FULL_45_13]OGW92979.1 MAG: 4Fe-4S ferredoxin [Omnitrophica bacterium RIFCSPLOWO2_01_FULL_45_24]